ncbi:hypothetical protein R1flu_009901 [Riccia fluitans]|uniref:Uncharacterized protein n=1 Tax=Riccia fluitans TaxID=41844 RepID=A0ABD1Z3G9_9MARC
MSTKDAQAEELKHQLHEKEEALKAVKVEDEGLQKKLESSQQNVAKLEKELNNMPVGVLVQTEGGGGSQRWIF